MSFQKELPLGRQTNYIETYSPHLLYPIPRTHGRDKIGLTGTLPFDGVDIWNGYEISWLNPKGKPIVALADFIFPCRSKNVVESKSFKLYLTSFSQSSFNSFDEVRECIQNDLSSVSGIEVGVNLFPLQTLKNKILEDFSGICLDDLDVEISHYHPNKDLLSTSSVLSEEALYTNLLKSNCLVTGQPDWGSLFIKYIGPKINHKGLLAYLISFRNHAGFGEHCVEQIFCDLYTTCQPEKLTVYGRYTRRGGLDINPFRSNFEDVPSNWRQFRQ